MTTTTKQTIGQIADITFPTLGGITVNARVDSGAHTSAVWATAITENATGLEVHFFGADSPLHTDRVQQFVHYKRVKIISSNGTFESRYKVQLPCIVDGRQLQAYFTLANRSQQKFPVLIGRNILQDTFIVDVAMTKAGAKQQSEPFKQTNQIGIIS